MKKVLFIFLFFNLISCEHHDELVVFNDDENEGLVEVTVFMFELCPIAQHMTLPLRVAYEEFSSEEVIFKAYFPNLTSTEETVMSFANKYSIPFSCVLDENQEMVEQFNASVYSEVFIHFSGNLVYKGMVNDSYSGLGQSSSPENHYLYDVLDQLIKGEKVNYFENEAVGCYI